MHITHKRGGIREPWDLDSGGHHEHTIEVEGAYASSLDSPIIGELVEARISDDVKPPLPEVITEATPRRKSRWRKAKNVLQSKARRPRS